MRTSLTEIQQIEKYLQGALPPEEALLFDAKLIVNMELPYKVQWHKQTLGLVEQYGRNNLKLIIADVHNQLFTVAKHETFKEKIRRLFL